MAKDLKKVFMWAKARGDANIYDRILIKIIPELLKENIHLTSHIIDEAEDIIVTDFLYSLVVEKTEMLLDLKYEAKE